jgi:hypothetical protein
MENSFFYFHDIFSYKDINYQYHIMLMFIMFMFMFMFLYY